MTKNRELVRELVIDAYYLFADIRRRAWGALKFSTVGRRREDAGRQHCLCVSVEQAFRDGVVRERDRCGDLTRGVAGAHRLPGVSNPRLRGGGGLAGGGGGGRRRRAGKFPAISARQ